MPVKHVYNLADACDAYWCSTTFREQQAAYHEILLFGGKDGFPGQSKWRVVLARWLRKLALLAEGGKNEKVYVQQKPDKKVNAVLRCLAIHEDRHPRRLSQVN